MSHRLILRLLAASAFAAACTGSNAVGDSAGTEVAKSRTSDGSLALHRQLPHDTISDRADGGRIAGDPKAAVWVVMASDFQCPYCKTWHDAAFQNVLKTYVNTGRVRLAFLNMPLSIHPNAVVAAEAAMCASVQNKFWPMHEALFAQQAKWEVMKDPAPAFETMATAAGVNLPLWRQCYTKHLTLALIQADHDRASASGAGSTPSFFVGDQKLSGADADVKGAIEAALAKAGKKPAN
jgi:protein-disulfide isomerase